AGLGLDHRPRRHAAELNVIAVAEDTINQISVGDQLAGRHWVACGIELIGAQEHLMRGMRGIGLVLIDERGSRVLVLVDVVSRADDAIVAGQHGGTRQHHELKLRRQVICRAKNVVRSANEGVIRLQRNKDGAIATLGYQIEAVIEELAKEREPGVEWCGQACIWRHVLEEEHIAVIRCPKDAVQAWTRDDLHAVLQDVIVAGCARGNAEIQDSIQTWIVGGRIGRWVVGRLVDDQVRDRTRLQVEYEAARLLIGCRLADLKRPWPVKIDAHVLRIAENRIRYAWEGIVCRAKLRLVGSAKVDEVVEFTGYGAQARRCAHVWYQREQVFTGRVRFGDLDLLQDEIEIAADEMDA